MPKRSDTNQLALKLELDPLGKAMHGANRQERERIIAGVRTLRRLLREG